jgi:hypothetical protein
MHARIKELVSARNTHLASGLAARLELHHLRHRRHASGALGNHSFGLKGLLLIVRAGQPLCHAEAGVNKLHAGVAKVKKRGRRIETKNE